MLLLFSVPNLSDDVYRFIWDGRLLAQDINPFQYLPSEIMEMQHPVNITAELYSKLNSPHYYAVYPPMMQWLFQLTALLFPGNIYASIIFLKLIIVLFEGGSLFLILQILKKISIPRHQALIYFLNPLVIAELTGNVHLEGIMIFFLLLSFLLLIYNRWILSAIFIGISIATKLVPVIFIPLIIKKLGWKKGFSFGAISALCAIFLFSLVINWSGLQHLLSSVNLFFSKFEFNASLYYLVRWIGQLMAGYNIIAFAGPLLSIAAVVFIILISFKNSKRDRLVFFQKTLAIICIWFLFATTVHPWYITTVIAMSLFTGYRFPILWSFTALLSYAAYHYQPVSENLWLLAAGYFSVAGYAFWELKNAKQTSQEVLI
jgi:hypothetical protein